MKKYFILVLFVGLTMLSTFNVNILAEAPIEESNTLSKEELIEEVLLKKYMDTILDVTKGKAYYCEKILDLSRLNSNRNHEVTIQVITYEGAHNPPYDLFKIKLHDYMDKISLKDVEVEKNISVERARNICNK
jgi:hypothetical protein